jgi:hypothetical protein
VFAPENDKKREELIGMLERAYWMEIETVMSYMANSINPDGVRAQEIIEALKADVTEELGHAQQFGRREGHQRVKAPAGKHDAERAAGERGHEREQDELIEPGPQTDDGDQLDVAAAHDLAGEQPEPHQEDQHGEPERADPGDRRRAERHVERIKSGRAAGHPVGDPPLAQIGQRGQNQQRQQPGEAKMQRQQRHVRHSRPGWSSRGAQDSAATMEDSGRPPRFTPSALMLPMIAKTTRAAISPYSMAIAALVSSRRARTWPRKARELGG